MKNSKTKLPLLLTLMVFQVACSTGFEVEKLDGADGGSGNGNYLEQLQNDAVAVFEKNCYSCHAGGANQGGFDYIDDIQKLTTPINGITMVVPGAPELSLLYQRMTDSNLPMPVGGLLPDSEIEKVYNWIKYGFESSETTVSFIEDIKPILDQSCVACHSEAGGNQGEVNLETFETVSLLTVPFSPEQSLLYDSIFQERMPKGGPALPIENVNLIYDWIAEGAQNN